MFFPIQPKSEKATPPNRNSSRPNILLKRQSIQTWPHKFHTDIRWNSKAPSPSKHVSKSTFSSKHDHHLVIKWHIPTTQTSPPKTLSPLLIGNSNHHSPWIYTKMPLKTSTRPLFYELQPTSPIRKEDPTFPCWLCTHAYPNSSQLYIVKKIPMSKMCKNRKPSVLLQIGTMNPSEARGINKEWYSHWP